MNKKGKIKFNSKALEYYMFDWDDNILIMPTMIHLETLKNGEWVKMDVTTSEFTDIRHQIYNYYENNDKSSIWRFANDNRNDAFSDFRDIGPRGSDAFLDDTKKSIRYKKYGPVWNKFINCIVGGHKFLIITARGHEPETIRKTVKWIIHNILESEQIELLINNLKCWLNLFNKNHDNWTYDDYIDHYLEKCYFIGTQSNWFVEKFTSDNKAGETGEYKAMAIKYFVSKISKYGDVLNKKIKVGFSDDDLGTIQSIHKYFKNELSLDFPFDYHIYHSKKGKAVKINL